jgi:hypothetical protein
MSCFNFLFFLKMAKRRRDAEITKMGITNPIAILTPVDRPDVVGGWGEEF